MQDISCCQHFAQLRMLLLATQRARKLRMQSPSSTFMLKTSVTPIRTFYHKERPLFKPSTRSKIKLSSRPHVKTNLPLSLNWTHGLIQSIHFLQLLRKKFVTFTTRSSSLFVKRSALLSLSTQLSATLPVSIFSSTLPSRKIMRIASIKKLCNIQTIGWLTIRQHIHLSSIGKKMRWSMSWLRQDKQSRTDALTM